MTPPPRDMNATRTWYRLDEACRARGWGEGRIEDGIEKRLLRFRGFVRGEGSVTSETLKPDWTIEKIYGNACKLSLIWLDNSALVEEVEVELPGDDADEAPSPQPSSPSPAPVSRKPVAEAELERVFRKILAERLDDPPTEPWLLAELTDRLRAPPVRKRVRNMWKTIAPNWKRPRGHPRKAKN